MDFGVLPPEVNSGRMYSGPGPGPMLAAATAWATVASELELTAGCYQSVLSDLVTDWVGPSATRMAAAVTPYVTWMHGAAGLAEQTSAQAHVAAAAFEAAFAMTVPPPVIAANRSQLLALVATNFFGQNTPAIAATEAAYAVMWAQDAAAMYGYAAAAAGATTLTPFTPPPETTNPVGSFDQAGAVGRAVGSATAANINKVAPALLSAPAATAESAPGLSGLPANSLIELSIIPLHLGADLLGAVVIDGLGAFAIDAPGAGAATLLKEMQAASRVPYVLASASSPGATAMSAGMGQAVPVSGLSVPRAWTMAASESGPVAAGQPGVVAQADSELPVDMSRYALAGMAGLAAMGGLSNDQRGPTPGSGRRITPPAEPPLPEVDATAALRELMNLHGDGILTDKEFAKERERLFAE